ncbi:THO complex subunit 4B-like [Silene latifolia]|uniref:THO complex subunit 4B-like n=1 Tax=Silene latifolia TaxID=37657 RepID=UPI003D784154
MANNLDMSLDDLIKSNKSSSSSRSGGHRRSGAAPPRRFDNRVANRAAPYSMPKAPDTLWKHDMFGNRGSYGGVGGGGGRREGESSIETGTKIYISNLDYGVSTDDVKELFSEVGDLKRYTVHYDRSGRSKGTAEVVYSRRNDALAAVKRYNNVELDGKPIKIEIVGTNISSAGAPPPAFNGFPRNPLGYDRMGRGRGGPMGRPRGGRSFGRGRGRGRDRDEKISAEDLDAELEKYHSAAVKTEEPMKTDE